MILLVIHLFKFHYDSINSVQMLIILPKIIDLNSIMILLIRITVAEKIKGFIKFKFHYDSINSEKKNIIRDSNYNI